MGMTPAPATMPGCIAIGCMPTACIPGIAGCCMGIPAIIGCSHSPATFRPKRKIGRARSSWISEAYLARHGHDPAHRSHPGYHRRLLHSHPHPHALRAHHSLHRAAEVHAGLSCTCKRTSLSHRHHTPTMLGSHRLRPSDCRPGRPGRRRQAGSASQWLRSRRRRHSSRRLPWLCVASTVRDADGIRRKRGSAHF